LSFLDFTILDLIDILLTAFLLYQVYRLMRGTVAIRIFFGIAAIFVIWKLVQALNMVMLSQILGSFIGLGVIVLIIVFQQEIRKFLLYLGSGSFHFNSKLVKRFLKNQESEIELSLDPIIMACQNMMETKTGAIIVFTRDVPLGQYIETGEMIDANISARLLENIFFKDTPLHDGAIILQHNKILSAGSILPVSESISIPKKYGLRHRAALGVAEKTDAICIVISEERGNISLVHSNVINPVTIGDLKSKLHRLLK